MLTEFLLAYLAVSVVGILLLFGPIAWRQHLHEKTRHLAPVEGDEWRLAGYWVRVHPALEFDYNLPGRRQVSVVNIETKFGWVTIPRASWTATVRELDGYRVRSSKNGR